MGATLAIKEIIDRSEEGLSRPFRCLCEDDNLYYVKGREVGPGELIHEWIGASLAKACGLPVPDFACLEVDPILVATSARPDIDSLGAGYVFGSRAVQNAMEFSLTHMKDLSPEHQAEILLFDWWIGNGDRTLDVETPNPNLLFTPDDRKVHLIDHGCAFSPWPHFWEAHAFRNARPQWSHPGFRDGWETRLESALENLDQIWNSMPSDWTEHKNAPSVESIRTKLGRFRKNDQFWEGKV